MSGVGVLSCIQTRNSRGAAGQSTEEGAYSAKQDSACDSGRRENCYTETTGKSLLAGLYELPNLLGHLTREEVLDKVKNMQLEPLYIEKLPDAKHIFSAY